MKKSEVRNDQYFTIEKIAKDCVRLAIDNDNDNEFDVYIEPSAGTGNIFRQLPESKRIGLDIDPKHAGVLEVDFFSWKPDKSLDDKSICFIGNPPFGKNSSLAVKFFNHAAKFGDKICFIVPRTFRKESLVNRLNDNFHLDAEYNLPKKSFELDDGTVYPVACVFQIWKKSDIKRLREDRSKSSSSWKWVKKDENPDYAIRRVGCNAGKIFRYASDISQSSHYFIKADKHVFHVFVEMFDELYKTENYKTHKFDTSGNPSLSKSDIVEDYDLFIL